MTHSWNKIECTDKQWIAFVENCKRLLEATEERKIIIRGGLGNGNPEFSETMVIFNGDEENGLDHETFYMKKEENGFNYCKTNGKPYNILVCACLIAANYHLNCEILKDDNMKGWFDGIALYYMTQYDGELAEDEEEMKKKVVSFLPDFINEPLNENKPLLNEILQRIKSFGS